MATESNPVSQIPESLQTATRLQRLAARGMKIEEDGRIVDADGRPTAISSHARRLRNTFSAEDDRVLADWVTRAERQGIRITGFQVFQDLERVNPRHTYQSWHARWTKKIQKTPRPEVRLVTGGISRNRPEGPQLAPPTTLAREISTTSTIPDSTTSSDSEERHAQFEQFKADGDTSLHILFSNQSELPERSTVYELRRGSEQALRRFLDLRNRSELATWLIQDWVIDAYAEYAEEDLDWRYGHDLTMEELEDSVSQRRRGSSKKYIVHQATAAVRSNSERYLRSRTKAGWTADDHAIRFIARIVHEGRASGRWWDRRFRHHDLEDLCTFGWILMSWLRCIYSLTTATSSTSQYQRANHLMWIELLNNSRRKRRLCLETTTVHTAAGLKQSEDLLDSAWQTPVDVTPLMLANSALSTPRSGHEMESKVTWFSDEDSDSANSFYTAQEEPRPIIHILTDDDRIELPPSNEKSTLMPSLQLPRLPAYTVKVAKKPRSKGNTSIWLLQSGKVRFETQQKAFLSSWGVTGGHSSSCILVPQVWASADPTELCRTFSFESYPPSGSPRLTFMLSGFTPSYVRAMTWFAEERRGIDLDNFLGSGPFMPMEGSHLCHHGHCINPRHCKYEQGLTNSNRERCVHLAWGLRKMDHNIPQHCPVHEPPCLLQNAALTRYETFCIQFAILRRVKGLPAVVPPRPSDHPYRTFEYELPLTFTQHSITWDSTHLMSPAQPPQDVAVRSPVFYCPFCNMCSFKTVIGYWTHLREKERLVSDDIRLAEVRKSSALWRDHLEWARQQGHGTSRHDPTWLKLQQTVEDNFSWEVVMSWKLGYNRGGGAA